MPLNHASTRAATALLQYLDGTGAAPLPVRDLCRRLLNALDLRGDERSPADPRTLSETLEAAAARDANVRFLLRDLAAALPPEPRGGRQGGGGMDVNVQGNGNVVYAAGRDIHNYGDPAAPGARGADQPPPRKMTVLFAAASPDDQDYLRADREARAVREALERAGLRDQFDLQVRMAVSAPDFLRALLTLCPRVVHFAGHGEEDSGELQFEDDDGKSLSAAAEGLAVIFSQLRGTVECVILNACYGKATGDAILASVPYVIAMEGEMEDDAAIPFSTGFYQALGEGRSVPEAFQFGRGLLMMTNRWQKPPELLTRGGGGE
ncbi:MAG TPA: CHAT domain-containing protein [Longimicrobium sp.]|nr:CHAT domain-containing protein [Longimicrobium sp.]